MSDTTDSTTETPTLGRYGRIVDPPATTTEDPATETTEPTATVDPAALQREIDKWKHQARENEKRAKANAQAATELEKVKASQMSETEKAIAEAKAAARSEVLTEVGSKLARAEVRAALAGVVESPDEIIADLDMSRFVDAETGEPDPKAIDALKAKWQKLVPATQAGHPKVPTGKRSDGPAITREQLKSMTPQQIVAADDRGELKHLFPGGLG